jgi:chromosome segregation ATPase
MGWGRTFFLGDVGNRLDIAECEKDIKVLKESLMQIHDEGQSQDAELMAVQRECDQLKLYIAALIRLLTGKGVLDIDEIRKMVDVIDGEDGAMDGKARNTIL